VTNPIRITIYLNADHVELIDAPGHGLRSAVVGEALAFQQDEIQRAVLAIDGKHPWSEVEAYSRNPKRGLVGASVETLTAVAFLAGCILGRRTIEQFAADERQMVQACDRENEEDTLSGQTKEDGS